MSMPHIENIHNGASNRPLSSMELRKFYTEVKLLNDYEVSLASVKDFQ